MSPDFCNWTGTNNINADPLFAGEGDYHLQVGSSCIDQGTSAGAMAMGSIEPVLARLDPLLAAPIDLTNDHIRQLIAFVKNGLPDPRAKPDNLRHLVPRTVPSGRPPLIFEFP